MAKAKKETLRQQMRAQAEIELDLIATRVIKAVCEVAPDIAPLDIMKLCSSNQTTTLRAKLVGEIANRAEAELLELWNDQQNLDLEKKDAE